MPSKDIKFKLSRSHADVCAYLKSEFEEMSCQVLNIFDRSSDDLANGIILLQKIPYYNLDCLQMAVEAECMDFLSLPSVQNLLTDIWNGKIENKPGFKSKFKVFTQSRLYFYILTVISSSSFVAFHSDCWLRFYSSIPKQD